MLFRSRNLAPNGHVWLFKGAGRGKYVAIAVPQNEAFIRPDSAILPIKVPDATPGIIKHYTRQDEQALLAKIRYNRLIDIFTGVVCYSLQNHYRTFVEGWGQTETDELYVGVDRKGAQYVFPVEAKGEREELSIIQIEQDFAVGEKREFKGTVCRPIGAQFMANDVVALFEFGREGGKIGKVRERHYRLVPPEDITTADLQGYQAQPLNGT